jgi:hypothetical protein
MAGWRHSAKRTLEVRQRPTAVIARAGSRADARGPQCVAAMQASKATTASEKFFRESVSRISMLSVGQPLSEITAVR